MNGQDIKYISLFEAAKLTSYSQEYISLLCRQKKMKGTKIGRNWVTTKEWVEGYINKTKGNGQNVIPVKIKTAEDTELNSEASELSSLFSSAENTPAGDGISPAIGKLILTAVICSLFISGFIFLRLGSQKGIINKSIKLASGKIIAFSNSLNVIKNEANKKSANEMAEVSESQNDSNSSVLTSAESITDENSLSKSAATKKSPNGGDDLESQDSSRNLELAPVADSITYKNNLSTLINNFFGGGSAGNRTPETQVLTLSSDHPEPTANLLYQINSEKSKLAREIIFLSGSLDLIKNESAGSAADGIIALSWSLENAGDGGRKLLAESKNNLGESFGGHSERIKNNLKNFAEPLRTKLAKLSRSKDIIIAAVSGGTNINKFRQGRVAGVSDESSDAPESAVTRDETNRGVLRQAQDDIIGLSNSLDTVKNTSAEFIANKIISLSGSLSAIKNGSAEFSADKIIALNNSLNTIKNESTKFAMNETDKLYYSLDFIKNKSEEKVGIALNKFGIGEKSPLAAENPGEAKSKESTDKLEREIIGDIRKRFDEFNGEQAYLPPAANQNYGAAVVPYSDAQDKDKKIENLKESFSDGVSIEEDEDGKTGTITADILGEDQKYLYLMVPMKE